MNHAGSQIYDVQDVGSLECCSLGSVKVSHNEDTFRYQGIRRLRGPFEDYDGIMLRSAHLVVLKPTP